MSKEIGRTYAEVHVELLRQALVRATGQAEAGLNMDGDVFMSLDEYTRLVGIIAENDKLRRQLQKFLVN